MNSWSVKKPSGTCRMCSSSSSSSCGGVASEKLRRLPSFSRKSMYWPARNCSRSFAGSLSFTIATSGAALSIDSTRHGSLLIWMSPARRTSRTSITRSVERPRAAEEREPVALFLLGQRRRLIRAVVDVAGEDAALARAARAVAAAVRQHQVGAHRRREHRLVRPRRRTSGRWALW